MSRAGCGRHYDLQIVRFATMCNLQLVQRAVSGIRVRVVAVKNCLACIRNGTFMHLCTPAPGCFASGAFDRVGDTSLSSTATSSWRWAASLPVSSASTIARAAGTATRVGGWGEVNTGVEGVMIGCGVLWQAFRRISPRLHHLVQPLLPVQAIPRSARSSSAARVSPGLAASRSASR
jgi:hypothetical protein